MDGRGKTLTDIIRVACSKRRKPSVCESSGLDLDHANADGTTLDLLGVFDSRPSTPNGYESAGLSNSGSLLGNVSSAPKEMIAFDEDGNLVLKPSLHGDTRVGQSLSHSIDTSTIAIAGSEYQHAYKRSKPTRWSSSDTRKFAHAISVYGLDLTLIGTVFPQYSAVQIRQKLKSELKRGSGLLRDAMHSKRSKLERIE